MTRRWNSLRVRLTLVYGSLFFAAGLVLLGVTYVLVDHQPGAQNQMFSIRVEGAAGPGSGIAGQQPILRTSNGDLITADEAPSYIAGQQKQLRDATMTSMLTQGAIALVLVGSAAVAFGWLIAGRVLSPLQRVTETARRMRTHRRPTATCTCASRWKGPTTR